MAAHHTKEALLQQNQAIRRQRSPIKVHGKGALNWKVSRWDAASGDLEIKLRGQRDEGHVRNVLVTFTEDPKGEPPSKVCEASNPTKRLATENRVVLTR